MYAISCKQNTDMCGLVRDNTAMSICVQGSYNYITIFPQKYAQKMYAVPPFW